MNPGELRSAFVLASEFKEGDLALGGTSDERLRAEARRAIAALRVGEIAPSAFVDDGVSEALARSLDAPLAAELAPLTIAELKRLLLGPDGSRWAARNRGGLGAEVIAAVAKLMSNEELARVACALFNPLPGGGVAIGSAGHFGSRIQPNSPGDDEEEILLSILEGLAYGCGDVILGLNPASDDVDTIVRLERLLEAVVERLALPTRFCVLSDIVKQTRARARTRVDVGFQSLAGTSKALGGMVGLDVDGLAELARGFPGLYFETGQGSEVTNGAAEGVDMVTLEARAYGVARAIAKRRGERGWTIVNDVAGFIGPEVFRTPAQLERACLEDVVMAKLHGLTMGLDVCSTFHMGIEPQELRHLTETITVRGAPAYLMAVAGNADPMLGYLTTSFREHPRLRRRTGRRLATAMEERLTALGAIEAPGDGSASVERTARLYAAFAKAGGETRSSEALCGEAKRKIDALRGRGFDLGYGHGPDFSDPPEVGARIDALYAHARRALYAKLDDAAIADAAAQPLRVRNARPRSRRLSRPSAVRGAHSRRGRREGRGALSDATSGDSDRHRGWSQRRRGQREPSRGAPADPTRPSGDRAACRRPRRRRRRRSGARRLPRRRSSRRRRGGAPDRRTARDGPQYALRVSHLRPRPARTIAMEPRSRPRGDDGNLRHSSSRQASASRRGRDRSLRGAHARGALLGRRARLRRDLVGPG